MGYGCAVVSCVTGIGYGFSPFGRIVEISILASNFSSLFMQKETKL
jgi:hypothetical protein